MNAQVQSRRRFWAIFWATALGGGPAIALFVGLGLAGLAHLFGWAS